MYHVRDMGENIRDGQMVVMSRSHNGRWAIMRWEPGAYASGAERDLRYRALWLDGEHVADVTDMAIEEVDALVVDLRNGVVRVCECGVTLGAHSGWNGAHSGWTEDDPHPTVLGTKCSECGALVLEQRGIVEAAATMAQEMRGVA